VLLGGVSNLSRVMEPHACTHDEGDGGDERRDDNQRRRPRVPRKPRRPKDNNITVFASAEEAGQTGDSTVTSFDSQAALAIKPSQTLYKARRWFRSPAFQTSALLVPSILG